jgi:hypothetical protein
MTIYSSDRVEARGSLPLDAKMFVGAGSSFLYDTKEDIPASYRYKGMVVYEIIIGVSLEIVYPVWQLKGCILDANWVQLNSSSGAGTSGLIQTDTFKVVTSGYVSYFSLPGGYKQSNSLVYINGILIVNDTGIKPETDYTMTDHVTYSALEFVTAPEVGNSIVVVKESLYLT